MCEPVSIGLAVTALVLSITTTVTSQVAQVKQGKAQKKLATESANAQRESVIAQNLQNTEMNAQKGFHLATAALAAKGHAQNSGVSERSVLAIGRSIDFQAGQDQATIDRNQEIAAELAGAQLRGIDITLKSQKLAIGDTSAAGLGVGLGLGIASDAINSASLYTSLGGSFSSTKTPTPTPIKDPVAGQGGFPSPP